MRHYTSTLQFHIQVTIVQAVVFSPVWLKHQQASSLTKRQMIKGSDYTFPLMLQPQDKFPEASLLWIRDGFRGGRDSGVGITSPGREKDIIYTKAKFSGEVVAFLPGNLLSFSAHRTWVNAHKITVLNVNCCASVAPVSAAVNIRNRKGEMPNSLYEDHLHWGLRTLRPDKSIWLSKNKVNKHFTSVDILFLFCVQQTGNLQHCNKSVSFWMWTNIDLSRHQWILGN